MSNDVAEMRTLIGRMEQLLATPGLQASVNPDGTPGLVAAGELIESAWGNATSKSITRLFGYSVARITYSGAIATSGTGDFAQPVNFLPTAAFCLGTQVAFGTHFIVRDPFDSAQVVWRAFDFAGNVKTNATLGVTFAIFGPPAAP